MATVIDLASRAVLGCATDSHQSAELVSRALRLAHRTGVGKTGAIFHSDHGTQYRSKAFTRTCGQLGVRRSMGANFECWDNAVAESFFSKLKNEHLNNIMFLGRKAAAIEVAGYIDHFNNTRLHQSLGYLTPTERLAQYQSAA